MKFSEIFIIFKSLVNKAIGHFAVCFVLAYVF